MGPPTASALAEDPNLSLLEEAEWPSCLKGLILALPVPFTLATGTGLNQTAGAWEVAPGTTGTSMTWFQRK